MLHRGATPECPLPLCSAHQTLAAAVSYGGTQAPGGVPATLSESATWGASAAARAVAHGVAPEAWRPVLSGRWSARGWGGRGGTAGGPLRDPLLPRHCAIAREVALLSAFVALSVRHPPSWLLDPLARRHRARGSPVPSLAAFKARCRLLDPSRHQARVGSVPAAFKAAPKKAFCYMRFAACSRVACDRQLLIRKIQNLN